MSGMAYQEFGEGVPLIAVHGWPVDHHLVQGCLEPIFAERSGYRRIYPDLPGQGASPGDGVASSDDVLETLDAFIEEQVGQEPFLLVGESYGGLLARAIVNRRLGQVRGVALICPSVALPYAERTVPALQVMRRRPGALDGLSAELIENFTALAVVHTAEAVRRFLADVQPGLAAADPETVQRVEARFILSVDPDRDQPTFDGPSLILLGRQDNAVGYHDQLPLLERYPHASLAVLDVAGHNLQFEQPALFEALVSEWLDRVESDDQG